MKLFEITTIYCDGERGWTYFVVCDSFESAAVYSKKFVEEKYSISEIRFVSKYVEVMP